MMRSNCIKNTSDMTKENINNLYIVKDKRKKIDELTKKRDKKRKKRHSIRKKHLKDASILNTFLRNVEKTTNMFDRLLSQCCLYLL